MWLRPTRCIALHTTSAPASRNEDAIPSVYKADIPIRAINSDRSETKLDEWKTYAQDFGAIIIKNCGHYIHWEYPDKFNLSFHELIH